MLEKLIKNDRNEKLETVLEQKHIEEQVKNLLQGILYKIEVSYKDYQKAKVTSRTEKQYENMIFLSGTQNNYEKKVSTNNIVVF